MGIFGRMMDRIFGRTADDAVVAAPAEAPDHEAVEVTDVPDAPPAPMAEVDVEAMLEQLAEEADQPLNWRTSIVDLMKLLGMESSLAERRELAEELGYDGDTDDTASMNVWLHKQVMRKLAEHGGIVPADLLD
jgi:hypothetical protein